MQFSNIENQSLTLQQINSGLVVCNVDFDCKLWYRMQITERIKNKKKKTIYSHVNRKEAKEVFFLNKSTDWTSYSKFVIVW